MISMPAQEMVPDAERDRRVRSGWSSDDQGDDGAGEAWAQAQAWDCTMLDTR
jgi:hypothetical protein